MNKHIITKFRALAATANYLAQDRADIQYAAKEICRKMSSPVEHDFLMIKRLARYLLSSSLLCARRRALSRSLILTAACLKTRKSTSGGALFAHGCCVKWTSTQVSIATSSGETELYAAARAWSEALGLRSLMSDLGWSENIIVKVDSTAAIGALRKKGEWTMRHIHVKHLWMQDLAWRGELVVSKVNGKDNPADVLTKYTTAEVAEKTLPTIGLARCTGPTFRPFTLGVRSEGGCEHETYRHHSISTARRCSG
jgi:hypothetical protein